MLGGALAYVIITSYSSGNVDVNQLVQALQTVQHTAPQPANPPATVITPK